jgi:hypothetical protein
MAELRDAVGEADFLTIVWIAGAAAIASPIEGLIALWFTLTTALRVVRTRVRERCPARYGRLLDAPWSATIGRAPIAVGGFSTGFLAMYAFDLFNSSRTTCQQRSRRAPAGRAFLYAKQASRRRSDCISGRYQR